LSSLGVWFLWVDGCIARCPFKSWDNFNLLWVHPLFHYLS
jgi:hypothetical protein